MIAERRMVFACALGMLACILLALVFPARAHAAEHDAVTTAWHHVRPDLRLHIGFEAGIGGVISTAVFADPAQAGDYAQDGHLVQPWETTTRYRLAFAGGSCIAAGLGKEVFFDWLGPKLIGLHGSGVSVPDLAADAIGCTAGVAAGAGLGHGISVILTPKSAAVSVPF